MIGESGITGLINSLGHQPFHYTIFYVEVPDVAAHIAKAEGLGCKKIVGPIAIPTGTFVWISDPDGNTVGLWKSAAAQPRATPTPRPIPSARATRHPAK